MFRIDATFEDCCIHAMSPDGKEFKLQVSDNHTGEIADDITITAEQLSYIVQFNLHPDGEPAGFEKIYESLEPLFKDWSVNLRPIP